jgi:hypothetical protein
VLPESAQPGLEAVVIAAVDRFEARYLFDEALDLQEITGQGVVRLRTLSRVRAERSEIGDQGIDFVVAVEDVAAPGGREITMLAEAHHRPAQQLARHDVFRAPPQQAADALRRIGKDSLEPAIEGLVEESLRLLLGRDLEQRVDAGLDWALVQKVAAEGMDRANARQLQFLKGPIKPGTLLGIRRGARRLDFAAQMKPCFAGRLFGEGNGDDAVERCHTRADQRHDPLHEGRRLAGSGRGLDKKRRAELLGDATARFGIRESPHGVPRSASSGSTLLVGLRRMRCSSCGPQTAW